MISETLIDQIIDAYNDIASDELSYKELISRIAERCGCDEDTAFAALINNTGESSAVVQMYATDDGLTLGIDPSIGSQMNDEDVSDDVNGVAFYGIQALSSGIASLASSLTESDLDTEEILEIVEELLQDSFDMVDFPPVTVTITEKDENDIPLKNGNILYFPS